MDEAREAYQKALALFEELKDNRSKAVVLNNLGAVEYSCGNLEDAFDLFCSARDQAADAGHLSAAAFALGAPRREHCPTRYAVTTQ